MLFNICTMLTLNLAGIFKARGIEKPYTFLVKAGLSPHAAHTIINSKTRVFRLDHIELLCSLLVCEPNDLLSWMPEKGRVYPANNPLAKLVPDHTAGNLQETLKAMPYKELKETTKALLGKDK